MKACRHLLSGRMTGKGCHKDTEVLRSTKLTVSIISELTHSVSDCKILQFLNRVAIHNLN